jgi:hypothetical protein
MISTDREMQVDGDNKTAAGGKMPRWLIAASDFGRFSVEAEVLLTRLEKNRRTG